MERLKTISITPTDSTHFRVIESAKSAAAGIEQRNESVQAIIKPQPHQPTFRQEPKLHPQSTISQADAQISKLTPFPHGAPRHYTEPDSDPHVYHTEGQTCKPDTAHEQYTSGLNLEFIGSMEASFLCVCLRLLLLVYWETNQTLHAKEKVK